MDGAVLILLLVGIWLGSLLLASQLFFFRTLKHFPLNEELLGFASVDFCVAPSINYVTRLFFYPLLVTRIPNFTHALRYPPPFPVTQFMDGAQQP